MSEARGTPVRVLLVDDDPYLRVTISLEVPEVVLLEASTVHEALDLATAEEFDVVLVDVRLPDGDGLALVRELRRTPPLERVPVLVITAGHDEAHRAEVLRAGADEYLPKPLDPTDLVARIERLLAQHPDERRPRRLKLIGVLEGGGPAADPDPLPDGATADVAVRRSTDRERRGLRGLFRRG